MREDERDHHREQHDVESLLTRAHVLDGQAVHDHLQRAERGPQLGQQAERQGNSDGSFSNRRQVCEGVIRNDGVEQEALV